MARSDDFRGSFWQRLLRTKSTAPPAPTNAGLVAFQEGRHGDAERMLVADLARAERQIPEPTAIARALVDLAELYRGQARF